MLSFLRAEGQLIRRSFHPWPSLRCRAAGVLWNEVLELALCSIVVEEGTARIAKQRRECGNPSGSESPGSESPAGSHRAFCLKAKCFGLYRRIAGLPIAAWWSAVQLLYL